jgi:hypothetical protein
MKKTTGLPFICTACGLRYGDGNGPGLLSVTGDATSITVADNWMQCPRCGTMNKQALPDGEYNIRNGQWQLVRQIAKDLLSAHATQTDFIKLASLVREASASGDNVETIATSIERDTPFGSLAKTMREHPPGWGAVIVPIIISIVLWLFPSPLSGTGNTTPQQQSSPAVVQHLSTQQIDQLAHQIADDLEKQTKDIRVSPPARMPGRNQACYCGSGLKYKKCCGDPAKR